MVRYRTLYDFKEPCVICGKPMKKGQLIQEGFIRIMHNSCYRKQRAKIPKINISKLLAFEEQRKRRRKRR